MATTPRSDLVEQIEKALTDEVYDGGMGALSEAQFSRYVHRLAVTAAEVVVTEQGEPSAAQVHAAAVAIDPAAWESGIFYTASAVLRDESLARACAALRAAMAILVGEAEPEGEADV